MNLTEDTQHLPRVAGQRPEPRVVDEFVTGHAVPLHAVVVGRVPQERVTDRGVRRPLLRIRRHRDVVDQDLVQDSPERIQAGVAVGVRRFVQRVVVVPDLDRRSELFPQQILAGTGVVVLQHPCGKAIKLRAVIVGVVQRLGQFDQQRLDVAHRRPAVDAVGDFVVMDLRGVTRRTR